MSSSPLCLECGLCCIGTLHEYVEVEPAELHLVGRLGVTVKPVNDRAIGFRLPCVLYRKDRCSVYSDRPAACRAYRCTLLRELERGDVTLERALAVVRETKGLIAELDDHQEGKGLRRRLEQSWDTQDGLIGTGEARQANAAFALCVAALDVVLQRHFRGPREHHTRPDAR